ncbi:hypothetical protein [Paenibacillus lactis]|uniref:hypothetical protein n=1 Tax=Paenibacillus lactis TaxID=228574 RepID=UPI000491E0AE
MSRNPASVDSGNVKYSVENPHLLKFDMNKHHTTFYELIGLEIKATMNMNSEQVTELIITAPNGDEMHLNDKNVDSGDLSDFHRILTERIAALRM